MAIRSTEAWAAPPMHPGQRQHDPPKVGKVTRADPFAGATKEALAKRWEFAYPWHWMFPPWPGPGTCRVGSRIALSEGREAAMPFCPEVKPIDGYNPAILDTLDFEMPKL